MTSRLALILDEDVHPQQLDDPCNDYQSRNIGHRGLSVVGLTMMVVMVVVVLLR